MTEISNKKITCFARKTSEDVRLEGNVFAALDTKEVIGYNLTAFVKTSEEPEQWSHAGNINKDGGYNFALGPQFGAMDSIVSELKAAIIDDVEAEFAG
jgi:hypothetical protein